MKQKLWPHILIIVLITTDLLTKLFIKSSGVDYSLNKGIAFSFLSENATFALLLNIVGCLFIYVYFALKLKEILRNKLELFGIVLILSGGAANLLDRAINGGVIDFIKIFGLPTFNLADIFINLGFILLIISIFTFKRDVKTV